MRYLLLLFLICTFACNTSKHAISPKTLVVPNDSFENKIKGLSLENGYFNFYWDEKMGKIWLEINELDVEFLYINSLSAGVGSNDIGLDRGQLGQERVVKFTRSGNKILLTHVNYDFRAESNNLEERLSVEQAFAQSVLWGFKIEAELDEKILIDATKFLLGDAHHVIGTLKEKKQGIYKLEESRSAIYLPRTKSFPENTEFEATLTFVGEPKGDWIQSVVPSADAVTVRQHHSFVKLPDDAYKLRIFDPRSGFNNIRYRDYATPIDQPLMKRFITRHRLEKKDPSANMSEAKEPIIYYLDRGAPEPIKSALMEGAAWWNQAFEAAGYKNAFQVKELPADADPMDVRYNLIQWVHRSTRGWSYGSSVTDPRTGEIIKGHVSLGSLRVRQDFMIAQGLIDAYKDGKTPDPRMLEMALARLRQLSAHEVGHTLGLAHNFSASVNDRASVMDYPHPYITLDKKGQLDFGKAYDDKIGNWDKRTILYGYQDFPIGIDETVALREILEENEDMGFFYISDRDARPRGGAHPTGHLWDNGKSPIEELQRLMKVRETALSNFDLNNIPFGIPAAELERVLVPLYLSHRYQVEAVSKLLGGVDYAYVVHGEKLLKDEKGLPNPVKEATQEAAMNALLETLNPSFLAINQSLLGMIPPQPIGFNRDRETFKSKTGLIFDPIAVAESSVHHTLDFLLDPQRLNRVMQQEAFQAFEVLSVPYIFDMMMSKAFFSSRKNAFEEEIGRMTEKAAVLHLLQLAGNKNINKQLAAYALSAVLDAEEYIGDVLLPAAEEHPAKKAHFQYMLHEIEQFLEHPEKYQMPSVPKMPDGSPIGCGE